MKLNVKLKNCYGIKSLKHIFDFAKQRIFVIYAPNGSMKTSFAKTFTCLQKGLDTEHIDNVYPEKQSLVEIKSDDEDIQASDILVINSYEDEYKYSPNVAKLLANNKLKAEYDAIHNEIAEYKKPVAQSLEECFGNVKDSSAVQQIAKDIASEDKESAFFVALIRLEDEINLMTEDGFSYLKYNIIFNAKTELVFKDTKFQGLLEQYLEKYDELIKTSNFFKAGIFDHNNALDVVKSLKTNNFFHKDLHNEVLLDGKLAIKTDEELENIINDEKQKIINNAELKKLFDKVNKILDKNPQLREFSKYVKENRIILQELKNTKLFKEKLWKYYLYKNLQPYNELVQLYKKKRVRLQEISKEIQKDVTKWNKVINIFNRRFHVPFRLDVENKEDTVLKESYPSLKFYFDDEPIEQSTLIKDVLSQGEKRALYLIRVIFDIEARKLKKQKTLFIIDDIADSFDYQNKYAIIEYLRDILEESESQFYQIILTHNYDFYRTVRKRLIVKDDKIEIGKNENWYDILKLYNLHAIKCTDKIELKSDKYQNNPFDTWKKNLDKDEILISSIPFIRNITEYSHGDKNNQKYEFLTSLLHHKNNTTDKITILELLTTFKDIIPSLDLSKISEDKKKSLVIDVIYEVAKELSNKTDEYLELECKIALSIAIRLMAEQFMIRCINDNDYVDSIERNQTYELIKKYKTLFPNDDENNIILDKVNIMTPENIHINSFMYEPILDMSARYLRELYQEVSDMKFKGNSK